MDGSQGGLRAEDLRESVKGIRCPGNRKSVGQGENVSALRFFTDSTAILPSSASANCQSGNPLPTPAQFPLNSVAPTVWLSRTWNDTRSVP